MPLPIEPMLATEGPLPRGPEWAFEFKWDGMRGIATGGSALRLYSRTGNDVMHRFPELAGMNLPANTVVDGEIVALGPQTTPVFELLGRRMNTDRPAPALIRDVPVTFLVFDLLRHGDRDLCALPYTERRARLRDLRLAGAHWDVPPAEDDGEAVFAATLALGMEGVVAKRRASVYRPGVRSRDWVKTRHELTMDVVVIGWRPGARRLGALLVVSPGPDGAVYRGRVGSGISGASEKRLLESLNTIRRETAAFPLPAVERRGVQWVEPALVVEVAYAEVLSSGHLRHPRFRRIVEF